MSRLSLGTPWSFCRTSAEHLDIRFLFFDLVAVARLPLLSPQAALLKYKQILREATRLLHNRCTAKKHPNNRDAFPIALAVSLAIWRKDKKRQELWRLRQNLANSTYGLILKVHPSLCVRTRLQNNMPSSRERSSPCARRRPRHLKDLSSQLSGGKLRATGSASCVKNYCGFPLWRGKS